MIYQEISLLAYNNLIVLPLIKYLLNHNQLNIVNIKVLSLEKNLINPIGPTKVQFLKLNQKNFEQTLKNSNLIINFTQQNINTQVKCINVNHGIVIDRALHLIFQNNSKNNSINLITELLYANYYYPIISIYNTIPLIHNKELTIFPLYLLDLINIIIKICLNFNNHLGHKYHVSGDKSVNLTNYSHKLNISTSFFKLLNFWYHKYASPNTIVLNSLILLLHKKPYKYSHLATHHNFNKWYALNY